MSKYRFTNPIVAALLPLLVNGVRLQYHMLWVEAEPIAAQMAALQPVGHLKQTNCNDFYQSVPSKSLLWSAGECKPSIGVPLDLPRPDQTPPGGPACITSQINNCQLSVKFLY